MFVAHYTTSNVFAAPQPFSVPKEVILGLYRMEAGALISRIHRRSGGTEHPVQQAAQVRKIGPFR
jgi:hypothetical protein